MKLLGFKKISSLLLLFTLSISCATYQNKVAGPREKLKAGQFAEALEEFKKLADQDNRDQLVYMLDYATALQIAGQYQESAQAFIKADKLVDLNDYHSVSNVVGATLGGEEMVQYKGESYEKFLINTMNAINFLMLGKYDDAMVEVRRINDKISRMKMEGRDPYEQSPFARYLAALLWESQKKYDDAYIEYEGSYKLDSTNPLLPGDLLRAAKLARRPEAYQKWKAEFATVQEPKEAQSKDMGELIVIYQQGWGPEKHAQQNYRYPDLQPMYSNTRFAKVDVDGKSNQAQTVYNISKVAIQTLQKDYASLVARRVGGVVAKAVVADQIRQKDNLLGNLAWIAMNVADRADLRQWSTLPETIQISRQYVHAGTYNVNVKGLDVTGNPTADNNVFEKVVIKPGQKTFLNWRSLR